MGLKTYARKLPTLSVEIRSRTRHDKIFAADFIPLEALFSVRYTHQYS